VVAGDVIRDQWRYVCTGRDVMDLLALQTEKTWPLERDPYLLETSVPASSLSATSAMARSSASRQE
jgi:hypothetical protein